MYLEDMYQVTNKRDNAISKSKSLFRPWDSEKESLKKILLNNKERSIYKTREVNQDSTVSTTVSEPKVPNITSVDKKFCEKSREKRSHSSQAREDTVFNACSSAHNSQGTKNTQIHSVSCSLAKTDANRTNTKMPTVPENNILLGSECCNMIDPFNMYPEFVQNNFVNTLGISPNDSLLFESLAHGYALEEYARVLSQEQQAKLLNSKKQRPKKYRCPHCDVGFSNNGQLKGHIRIHTGERPFKCDEKDCGKTFTRNEELTRHKRIHSGLRPYPCTHCGKRFGRKDHLKKHSRTHFQPRGLYAVPVMLPFEAWASAQPAGYPCVPMYGY